jgi:hypothetical protein
MHTPLHPRLPGEYQTAAVQFERFDSDASNRGLANYEKSISAPSEVRTPPLSARVKKRNNFACFGITDCGPVAFQGITHIATERQICKIVTATFATRDNMVHSECFTRDTLLRLAILATATGTAADVLGEAIANWGHHNACIAAARFTINCS